MKSSSLLLAMVLLCLTACGTKPALKGTLFVRPFSVPPDANDTPDAVSSLLLETLLFSTHTQVLDNLHRSATLKPGMPCPEADYELIGRVESVGKFLDSTPGTVSRKPSVRTRITITMELLLQECSGRPVRQYSVIMRNASPLKLYVDVANSITEELGLPPRD